MQYYKVEYESFHASQQQQEVTGIPTKGDVRDSEVISKNIYFLSRV